ncbi:MAG: TIGR03086 family protein [Cryobacterium sp.]|nr:TIGR03086 family protein [Cryobacterium sp.]
MRKLVNTENIVTTVDPSMSTPDLRPTTAALGALVHGTRDDQLADPTPCPDYTVADLVDHIGGLALAFTLSARKETIPGGGNPSADGSRLEDGWRERIADQLAELGEAWTDPAAYEGMTQAGPIEMPAENAALVAVDEVTVHAWDLAVATEQSYAADPAAVAAAHGFVASFEPPEGGAADGPGLFGPPVEVADDAAALDRLLAATGRDPRWSPPTDSAALRRHRP